MASQISSDAQPEFVRATLSFGRRGVDGALLEKDIQSLAALERHTVDIYDGRVAEKAPNLEVNGLKLHAHVTQVKSFFDRRELKGTYVAEMRSLISQVSGASEVIILETLLRGSKELAANQPTTRVDEYAFKAHVDADGESFLRWASIVAPMEADHLEKRPFCVYTVWRPLSVVEEKPLALCDASTVCRDDLIPAYYSGFQEAAASRQLDYPPPVHYFHLAFNPDQRWVYFPNMGPDEVLIFKQWDSNRERPLCVPHTAFEDPTSRRDASPRSNIEARAIAFF